MTPAVREHARQCVAYLQGVAATLAWVLGHCDEAPVSHARASELTTRDLKKERVHAEDLIQQVMQPWAAVDQPPSDYGEGVKFSIGWLLGDTTVLPAAPR